LAGEEEKDEEEGWEGKGNGAATSAAEERVRLGGELSNIPQSMSSKPFMVAVEGGMREEEEEEGR